MNWVAWLGGSAAVIAVVAALYFAGFGGLVKAVRALFGMVGDAFASIRRWLSKPGSKLRALCGLFAVGFIAMGALSWQRGVVIEQERTRYVALQQASVETETRLRTDLEAKDLAIETFTLLAEKQKQLLADAEAASKAGMEQAYRDGQKAAASAAQYQAEFDKKPPECTAALSVMAKACKTLKDY